LAVGEILEDILLEEKKEEEKEIIKLLKVF
jgi:hypothetical protein